MKNANIIMVSVFLIVVFTVVLPVLTMVSTNINQFAQLLGGL